MSPLGSWTWVRRFWEPGDGLGEGSVSAGLANPDGQGALWLRIPADDRDVLEGPRQGIKLADAIVLVRRANRQHPWAVLFVELKAGARRTDTAGHALEQLENLAAIFARNWEPGAFDSHAVVVGGQPEPRDVKAQQKRLHDEYGLQVEFLDSPARLEAVLPRCARANVAGLRAKADDLLPSVRLGRRRPAPNNARSPTAT
jgi:hypothetical protein